MNTSRSNVRFRWLAGAVVSALALAACGSDDDASSAPETTAAQPGDARTLFRAELGDGGHSGPTGRYAHLAYEAEVAAFILNAVDKVTT